MLRRFLRVDLSRASWSAPGRTPPEPSESAESKPVPSEAVETARELIAEGRTIPAITEIRRATGYGLQPATDIVEAIRAGRPVPAFGRRAPQGPAPDRPRVCATCATCGARPKRSAPSPSRPG
ncbi:hypothetical protein GCM10023224_11110 [Streptomonospora halophila]|uniref:Ribosomal protein L7/L12 C-terminal domain-containing protein n=1 Tax=Streptomonospora halophila TaxID=427369 RepID=A0ABP9G8B2_9ACTN